MRCLNQDLANVFYRPQLIEAYGTGIGRIMKAYEGMEEKPAIETTKNTFKIILPNVNAKYETGKISVPKPETIRKPVVGAKHSLGDGEEKILEYARIHGTFTKNDIVELLKMSTSTASRVIRKMVKNNLLIQTGKARNTRYIVIK